MPAQDRTIVRHLVLLTVAALVTLAGCGAIDGGGSTTTITPVDVPNATTPLAPGIVPGDDPSRTVDPARLLAADNRIRVNTSHTLRRVVTMSGPNGSIRIERVRRVTARGTFVETLTARGTGTLEPVVVESILWKHRGRYSVRTRLTDGRLLVRQNSSRVPRQHSLGMNLSSRVLGGASYRAHRVDGRVRLVAERDVSLSRPVVPVVTGPPRSVSASLVVSDRGLIRQLLVELETRRRGASVDVTIRHRVTDLGTTAVSKPWWVNATESTGRTSG